MKGDQEKGNQITNGREGEKKADQAHAGKRELLKGLFKDDPFFNRALKKDVEKPRLRKEEKSKDEQRPEKKVGMRGLPGPEEGVRQVTVNAGKQ